MSNEQQGRRLAAETRAKAGLATAPIADVFEFASAVARADVLSIEAPEAEHGLSTVSLRTGDAVIAVRVTSNPMRQRSSVAHELGHFLAGDLSSEGSFTPGIRNDQEIRADAFARHLLLPLEAVKRFDTEAANESLLSRIVQEFGVSPEIAAIQLRETGLIDQGLYDILKRKSALSLAARHGWLNQYRVQAEASKTPRAPQRLMERATTAVKKGVIDLVEAAEWYGVEPTDLRDGLGIDVQEPVVDEVEDDFGIGTPLFGGTTNS